LESGKTNRLDLKIVFTFLTEFPSQRWRSDTAWNVLHKKAKIALHFPEMGFFFALLCKAKSMAYLTPDASAVQFLSCRLVDR
jgi:hypothetical protein